MASQPLMPPSLEELFSHYLRNQIEAQATGLGFAETIGDVVPHEAVPVQPMEPKQAWDDALEVLQFFPGISRQGFTAPPDWASLLSGQESTVALAFCLGNTPQLVRNIQPLLAADDLANLRVPSTRTADAPVLMEWSAKISDGPNRLVAAGVLRLAREFVQSAKLLKGASGPWQAVAANEAAAAAWHQGKGEEALALWNKQEPTPPVLFNRGMASLFLGDTATAKAALTSAVEVIAETSPWHHLGRLYLTLADGR